MTDPVAEGYDAVYAAWDASPEFHALWAEHAVDGSVAEGFEHLNFAPLEQLERIAVDLQLACGDTLLDVACGAGGPGLWVARQTGARLVGIDLSAVGTAVAARRAERLGIDATFVVGSITGVDLPDATAQGAMSMESFQYVSDKQGALREVARLLAPGGRFAFTVFEIAAEKVVGFPVLGDDPIRNYQPLLESAGFTVESYEQTRGWQQRLTAAYSATIASEQTLRPQLGDEAMDSLMLEMALTLEVQPYSGRAYIVARKSN